MLTRIYLAPGPGYGEVQLFACACGQRRVYRLGSRPRFSSSGGGGIYDIRLNGSTLAYQDVEIASESSYAWVIIVRDLRTGRVIRRGAPTGRTGLGVPSYERLIGDGYAVALRVKRDGAIGWIVSTGTEKCGGGTAECFEVHALDRTGERLLATASDIDPHSLALIGSTLAWTQDDKRQSALLY